AIVLASYAGSVRSGTVWDDEFLTTRNPNFDSWRGLLRLLTTDIWMSSAKQEPSGYYRPLVSLSFAFNRWLLGNAPSAYHMGNITIHAMVTIALFEVLRRAARLPKVSAVLVAALFATAPLASEPVLWISGRYDSLGTFFALLALLAHGSRRRRALAPIAYLAAVFCKEPFILVPFFLVAYDLLLDRKPLRQRWFSYAALGAAAVAYLVLRALVHVPSPGRLLEQGPRALVEAYAFSLGTFAKLAIFPRGLSPFRTYEQPIGADVVAILLAAFTTLVAILLWQRRSRRRAASAALFGLLWCLVAMGPGSSTATTLRIIGDRYAYFPLVGTSIALSALFLLGPRWRRAASIGVLVAVAAQAVALRAHVSEWRTADALYQAMLRDDPGNFTALTLLGTAQAQRGELVQAEASLLRARRTAPITWRIDVGLCFVYLREARLGEAEASCRAAVASNPNDPRAWLNLASVQLNGGAWEGATASASRAIALKPAYAEAYFVRAAAFSKLGRDGDARRDVGEALRLAPQHAGARQLRRELAPAAAAPP
ncbi:MAG TPA: hypothetical protein VF316_23200, partial [Polyangiaceae bacterium]